ncbi:hypothetical protein SARC_08620 [Sphaeroforma arctica JP610]|uniref:Phorbol-ester/DAG-type domain-containing protein n=1 Tax=Sphaeroforma arctica JP610 TaxID=667725 RepID=A0A0L0FQZ4_9EUKA|nr:hypothetical protein SARC_08620 [Sphaeroforma arctica JP610]KNC78966.1 hypothetical protein SARC_08620 [Sphaeroforma arctica JP610]|eukprot:XP_014152868.1 hypothetical protein SARC_08620 [Sphaeroforma arctica JP610]
MQRKTNPERRQRTRTNSKRGTMDKLNMSSDDVEQLRQAFLLQSASSLSESDAMIPRMSFCIPHRFQISPAKFFSHSTCGHCAKKPNYKQKAWKCTECAMVAHDECKSHILPKCGLRDLDLGVNVQTNDSLKLSMVEAATRQGRYIPFIVEALLMKMTRRA